MIKTAVLLATYNGENLLENQLDSIRKQTTQSDYVIVRDDKSTDCTVDYLKKYIKQNNLKNWKVYLNERNIGWKLTFRQLMLDALSYDINYVFFSDQDDIWQLDKIEKQLKIVKLNPKIEVLSHDFDILNTQTKEIRPANDYQFDSKLEEISRYPKRVSYISYRLGFTHMVKRELIECLSKEWNPYKNLAHDRLVTMISDLCGTGYNLNESLARHIVHGNNATGRPVITISSSKAEHLREIKENTEYFEIAIKVLKTRGYALEVEKVKEIRDFYRRRYESGSISLTKRFRQIIKDWKQYPGNSTRIRDIIFALKRK
ncbi:glycosyltransferase [Lactococcus petauri]|uniref:glycosyltransferase n=1 Tax=Lactococcus petauri TaxID=1940789 RepID=UPI0022E80049|nr:glycosyltransferase [Lactococcus petauri]